MHDIYYGTALPPHRTPMPITHPADRIGEPYLHCPPDKIVAVVQTHSPDRNAPFNPPDETSRPIAGHLVDFLAMRCGVGRLPAACCRCSRAWATSPTRCWPGWMTAPFRPLTAYTEVIQDGMLAVAALGHAARRVGDGVLAEP